MNIIEIIVVVILIAAALTIAGCSSVGCTNCYSAPSTSSSCAGGTCVVR